MIQNFIHGKKTGLSNLTSPVVDPSTGEKINDVILSAEEDFNKVIELSFDIRKMDVRSLVLILFSRSKLNQDIKSSNEYSLLNAEFRQTDWEQAVDRFHIQDDSIKSKIISYIKTI